MEYATQMDAARKGIVTKEMEIVAKKENIDVESLRQLIAKGQVIIPANKNHKCLDPNGIGNKLRTKINVNLGTSRDCVDLDMELEKVNNAVKMGAEAIMDLSSFGDTQKFRRKLTSECPATIGTVPIYDAVVYYHKALKDITAQEWLDVVEMHAKDGVDFMTIHCGINKATAKKFRADKRLMNIVSRGGSIIYAWMEMTGNENPFFEYYDRVLEICREYDVTMSLGDACRDVLWMHQISHRLKNLLHLASLQEEHGRRMSRLWLKDQDICLLTRLRLIWRFSRQYAREHLSMY